MPSEGGCCHQTPCQCAASHPTPTFVVGYLIRLLSAPKCRHLTKFKSFAGVQAAAHADAKALQPFWPTVLPVQTPSPSRAAFAPTLADVLLYDPHAQAGALLFDCKGLLSVTFQGLQHAYNPCCALPVRSCWSTFAVGLYLGRSVTAAR